jgi:chaperonin GroES
MGAHSMNVEPLGARILVQQIEDSDKTKGGIIIPDTARQRPMQGRVVAAGPGERTFSGEFLPMTVEPGDRIMFGQMAGHEVLIDGKKFLMMKLTEVMCRVKD